MPEITNYKCPACTGPLHFVGKSGKLECDYCGSSYDIKDIDDAYAEENQAAADAGNAGKTEAEAAYAAHMWGDGMKGYTCPSCGAELICAEETAASSCPYCGNPTVVPANLSGGLEPDVIIPFKLDKKDAVAALKNHYKGKRLLPRAFTDKNHIEEVKGIYVPFRLYDAEVDAEVLFDATRSSVRRTHDYEITSTEHFKVHRGGRVSFNNIPVDASSKLSDDYMDSIEPFDYRELKKFSMSYLPGFFADKYDVSDEDCAARAEQRTHKSAKDALAATVLGYTTVSADAENYRIRSIRSKYALLPVWLLTTRWNGQNFQFAVNGQTGKLVGDLPVDRGMFWKWFGIIAAPIAAVLAILMFLL